MGMDSDLPPADRGYVPSALMDRYQALVKSGIPPNVAQSMLANPSYSEGQNPYAGWPFSHGGQEYPMEAPPPQGVQPPMPSRPGPRDISYQPGASAMAGGWGNPGGGAPGMGGGLTPDMIKRIQLYQMLMQNRGAGGMVPNPLTQAAQQMNPQMPGQIGQQGGQQGGLMAMIMQNPQLLQWFMQQQQGGQGSFPQGGGGVTLAQLLGAPQQTGQPM